MKIHDDKNINKLAYIYNQFFLFSYIFGVNIPLRTRLIGGKENRDRNVIAWI